MPLSGILGLNFGELNSSAALLLDNGTLYAAPEERFIRQKKTKAFPHQALSYVLKESGSKLQDLKAIVQHWNPSAYWEKFNPLLSTNRIKREDYLYTLPDNLFRYTTGIIPEWTRIEVDPSNNLPPIYFLLHHRAHAGSAFFLSDFDQAAIYTADWHGEFESGIFAVGEGNQIKVIKKQLMPHSLGMFYSTWTEFLGYVPDEDEWKVMALSSYDFRDESVYQKIRNSVTLFEDGTFRLNTNLYKGAVVNQGKTFSPEFVEIFGPPLKPENEPLERCIAYAKAMQRVAEEIVWNALRALYRETRIDTVCLSGGFFMNCVCNGKIIENTPFKKVFIGHSPADVGNSIGSAAYVLFHVIRAKRFKLDSSSFIGPQYSSTEIESSLKRRKIPYERQEDPAFTIAKLLSEGEIVACFNGRMEFGERALGNRSILADPRKSHIKDLINSAIKHREPYRPFAPAVLVNEAQKWFYVPEGYECQFMEKTVFVRREKRKTIPAVTHVDGSARLQTVSDSGETLLFQILNYFYKLTGVPVLLNTSFNINKEPIVCSPDDALTTFFNSGLKYLVIGNFLISKERVTSAAIVDLALDKSDSSCSEKL